MSDWGVEGLQPKQVEKDTTNYKLLNMHSHVEMLTSHTRTAENIEGTRIKNLTHGKPVFSLAINNSP